MSFSIPPDLQKYLSSLDTFIDTKIAPLQNSNDNNRYFDHRREHARTDWENQGLPRHEWEDLLSEAVKLADDAGFYRFALSPEYGGSSVNEKNYWMAVIREHLASKGLGLFNDLQTEHSVVGNFPDVVMAARFGTPEQKNLIINGRLSGVTRITFGLTEPGHGSSVLDMKTRAVQVNGPNGEGWRITGSKKWQSGMNRATHCLIFARTAGKDGDARGITCFIVDSKSEGFKIESYQWALNMPTDHATISLSNVFVPSSSILGPVNNGLSVAQAFVHENRIRQAASSLGAAIFCINSSVKYANSRKAFGAPLSHNQGIQFPLVELATQARALRLLIHATALKMDGLSEDRIEPELGGDIGMCNYWANRLCCEAADRAIQVHGGIGCSREMPFEHIWRHHRRYRMTEGSEEIQMRKVAAYLFGFGTRQGGVPLVSSNF